MTATCKACLQPFEKTRPMQRACSMLCAQAVAEAKRFKKEQSEHRKKIRAHKEKDLPYMLAKAEEAVNKYVRVRDADKPCVSCDRPPGWWGQWHASHFRSVKAAKSIRFNLWNIHKACSICNNFESGNFIEYEPRLRARIGDAKVDWLKAHNEIIRYDVDYLKRLKKVFLKKARRAVARREQQA